jgi:tRNA 2-selenouridine synthase
VIVDVQTFLSLREKLPLVDVRSEGEYASGHVPSAVNIPLLNNEERVAVGTDYKRKGQLEAIKTGFRLVGPRLEAMLDEVLALGNELVVYCWRGGMRSSNFCQFASMAKIETHQLKGGYKAYRRLAAEKFNTPFQLIVLGGCTGSGKSEILRALASRGEQVIDLEKLARHKGSAFGGLMQPAQPTTEQFHNDLFESMLGLDPSRKVWVEDESLTIGKVVLPQDFWSQMRSAIVVEVLLDKSIRVRRLANEYGIADREEFLESMTRITRKLGGQHFLAAKEKLMLDDMESTIEILLTYYDKAYEKGLENKKARIKLRTSWDGVMVDHYAAQLLTEVDRLPVLV